MASGKISATDLCSVSEQGLQKRCPGKISVPELYKRSLAKISVKGPLGKIPTDLYAMSLHRSLYEISCASSLEEFPWQDLCKRPLGKISATDLYALLCTRSPKEVSWQDRCIRSLEEVS